MKTGMNLNVEDQGQLSMSDILNGNKVIKVSIEDNESNRRHLINESIEYARKDNKLIFDGKIHANEYIDIKPDGDNAILLQKSKIEYHITNNQMLRVDAKHLKQLALIGITIISPLLVVALMLIPKRKDIIKNEIIGLSKKEIEDLQLGKVLSKNLNGEKYLLQLDQELNAIQKVKIKNIIIPPHIAGVKLNEEQKMDLREGRTIHLSNNRCINLDMNEIKGMKISESRLHKSHKVGLAIS